MWGPGKGLGKEASWLQKLQMYSILKNNGVDPNIYAKNIPEKYVAKIYSDEDPTLNARTGKGKLPKNKKYKPMQRLKNYCKKVPQNLMKKTIIQEWRWKTSMSEKK